MKTNSLGQAGEELAAQYLQKKGYQILARNFSTPFGELDLVAQQKNTLIFIEVKTRSYRAFGGPLGAVTPAKQTRLSKTAYAFIKAKSLKFDSIRFDVVCILPGNIEHIEHAFVPPRNTF